MSTALLLQSCLLVDDFGAAWKESAPDTCLNKITESLYATEFRRDPTGLDINTLAHGWTHEGQHYILLKKSADDKGGRLYRFTVVHGILQRWRLNPVMKETFEKDYPDAPVSLKHDTVRLDALNAKELALLTEIAGKPEYWQIEEQTLYNPLRNEACRFDDRDLKNMKE